MTNIAEVHLREEKKVTTIKVSDSDKPQLSDAILAKWQSILNLITKIMNVPAGLIMKLDTDSIEVFMKNTNLPNPYETGDREKLCSGLYCETVVGKNEPLLVPNALNDNQWKDNPDVKLEMISYLGMPIHWPDDEVFGTICVLDDKENKYNQDFIELLELMRLSIEADLDLLIKNTYLKELSVIDPLTGLYNRTEIVEILHTEFERFKRYNIDFSLMLIDIDNFKEINDKYGHLTGDIILQEFSQVLNTHVRKADVVGRWGGEEFIVVCPETTLEESVLMGKKVLSLISQYMYTNQIPVTASIGVATTDLKFTEFNQIIKEADEALYRSKRTGKNRVEH